MSFGEFLGDVEHGNFEHAFQRAEDWWAGMPPWLKDFVTKAKTAEGAILSGLVATAAQDVVSGGMTTDSFVVAANDVEAKLVAQEISFGKQEVFAGINLAVNALKQANPTPVSTDPAVLPAPAPAG